MRCFKETAPRPAGIMRLLLLVLLSTLAPSSAQAGNIPPGGMAVSSSGADLTLSFASAAPQYYTVQSSPDLQAWTNCQIAVIGDGTVKSVTISNAISARQAFYRFLVQTPARLELPQSTAFAILGYWCGGISERMSAGFDVVTGLPTGVIDLSTTCGGSGRDGGGHSTTHTASALVTWDFAGNVVAAIPLTNSVTNNPTIPSDATGDVIYASGAAVYLIIPVPAAPANVTAAQTSDQFDVSWSPNAINPAAITSSTLVATPVDSTASNLTTTVSGPATSGIIPGLQPATTYWITVVTATIGGSSPPSAPIAVTTSPATIPPSAPIGVVASWAIPDPSGSTDALIATWQSPDPGNSPIDQYLVTISGSDGGGKQTQTVSGATLSTQFSVDYIPNWSLTVQAHNAAGWGPVSTNSNLGGL